MNQSEYNNAAAVLVTAGGPIVARWGVDATSWGAVVSALVSAAPAIGGALWLIVSHWNMKKVPETAVVVSTGK